MLRVSAQLNQRMQIELKWIAWHVFHITGPWKVKGRRLSLSRCGSHGQIMVQPTVFQSYTATAEGRNLKMLRTVLQPLSLSALQAGLIWWPQRCFEEDLKSAPCNRPRVSFLRLQMHLCVRSFTRKLFLFSKNFFFFSLSCLAKVFAAFKPVSQFVMW